MTKYRVVEYCRGKYSIFVPERRFFYFWWMQIVNKSSRSVEFFNSIEEAEEFIKTHKTHKTIHLLKDYL